MQKQSFAPMALIVLSMMMMMMKPCNGFGMMMVNLNQPSNVELMILPSLDHTPTHPRGNGCNNTGGNGGNGCVPGPHYVNNNGKDFAGRRGAATTAAFSPPVMVVSGGVTANRKLMMKTNGASNN